VINRDEIFDGVMDTFLVFNDTYLHKKTLHYLSATDRLREEKIVLDLSQLGMLYNVQPMAFAPDRFDNELLSFLSKYRDRISFMFLDRAHAKKKNNHIKYLYLVRITITNLHRDERDLIGEFVANNLDKYKKFTRQTVSYEKYIDDERVINIKQLSDQEFIQKRRDYKDLTLIFGY
jgi:hypothetical protein